MAKTFLSGDPIQSIRAGLGARGADEARQPEAPPSDIGQIAARYQVPRNVLMALDETTPGESSPGKIEGIARKIAAGVAAGRPLKDLVPADAQQRANRIADWQERPEEDKAQGEPKGGLGAALGVGVDALQQGYGSAIEGLGRSTGVRMLENYGGAVADWNRRQIEEQAPGLTGLDEIDGIGSAARWYGETLASQAPQIGLALGAMGAGALAGGAMAGPPGALVGSLIAPTAAMFPTFYGQNRERQKEAGSGAEVDEGSAAATAVGQASLESVVDRLLVGPVAKPFAKAASAVIAKAAPKAVADTMGARIAARFLGGAAQGVPAEVVSEVGQQALERWQAGLPLMDDDAAKEYRDTIAMAAAVGGTLGGAANAIRGGRASQPEADLIQQVGEGAEPPEQDTESPADGSGGGQGAAPLSSPPQAGAGVAPDEQPLLALPAPTAGGTIFGGGPVRDPSQVERQEGDPRRGMPSQQPAPFRPAGPLARAAQIAPDLTPQPEAQPLFPEQKAGNALRVYDPEADVVRDAVFQGERPDGTAVIRFDGVEMGLKPEAFDRAVAEGRRKDEEAARIEKAVEKGLKEQEKRQKAEARVKEAGDAAPKPAPLAPVPTPAPASIAPTERPAEPGLTPEKALRSMRTIEDTAKRGGWSARLLKRHAEMARSAAPLIEAEKAQQQEALPDAGSAPEPAGRRPETAGAAVQPDGPAGGEALAQGARPVEQGLAPDQALPEGADAGQAGIEAVDAPLAGVDGAVGDAERASALTDSTPSITDIRTKAAVLRGVPKDAPPAVPGVSLKWDDKAGGFIFSRKHRPAVEQAMGLAEAPTVQPQQKESISGEGMQEGRQGREEVAPADAQGPAADADADAVGRAWDAAGGAKRHQMLRDIGVQMKADGKLPAKFSRVPYMKWAEFGAEDKAALAKRLAPLVRDDAAKAEEARRGRRAALDEVGDETLDAMEARHREILGRQPFKNGEGHRFTDEIAVGARLARYNSAFDPSMNPAARKVFEEFTGVKLPKTIKGTKEVLEKGPYDLKIPQVAQKVEADPQEQPAASESPAPEPAVAEIEPPSERQEPASPPEAKPDPAEAIAAAAAETDPNPTEAQVKAKAVPTLYAERKVENASEIIAWARQQGFKSTLPADKMHVTVAFSRDPVDTAKAPADAYGMVLSDGSKNAVEKLGDAVVLALDPKNAALQAGWKRYRDAGASWDFESYRPHITISYDQGGVDLEKVEPFRGEIMLSPETHKPLDQDGGPDIREIPTSNPAPEAEPEPEAATTPADVADAAKVAADKPAETPRERGIRSYAEQIEGLAKARGVEITPAEAKRIQNGRGMRQSADEAVDAFLEWRKIEASGPAKAAAAEMRDGLADAKPITAADLAPIAAAVQAEVARLIPGGKVTARVVRGLLNAAGVPILGRQRGAQIEVAATEDAKGVTRHEIGHALRDPDLWGTPYGLFTREEWVGLVRESRQNPEIVAAVEKAYKGKPASVQTEEMVMERWRLYAEGIDARGVAKAALDKIKALFQAVANALRGRGFQSEALTFERMAAGRIGRRAMQARGPDGRFAGTFDPTNPRIMEMRDTGPFGPIVRGYEGNWKGAALALERLRSGEAPGALYHPDIGPIALVWGSARTRRSDGYGLSKIIAWHPEVLDDLQGRIARMSVTSRSENRVQLESEDDRAGVRLDWDGQAGVWLIGAYEKGAPRLAEKFTGTLSELWGEVAPEPRRGEDYDSTGGEDGNEMRAALARLRTQPNGERGVVSQILTDAMGGKGPTNLLALVPGEPLLAELGKTVPSLQAYRDLKHAMATERNERQAKADEVAQRWRKLMRGKAGRAANNALMDLMHESTVERMDPSRAFVPPARKPGESADMHVARIEADRARWEALKVKLDALPEDFQAMYREVRDFYRDMADAEELAVLNNVRIAAQVNLERAKRAHADEMQRIRDDGLEGGDYAAAKEAADKRLAAAKRASGWGVNARLAALRSIFESNRIEGPYFPLGRFGNYFVTVRDADGKVVSFSKFESEREQQAFAAEQKAVEGQRVQTGVMADGGAQLRAMIDPTFVADVENLVGEAGGDNALMDAIWQRYLESLPDLSIRKSRLHRKGTPGFTRDAFRVFGVRAFHGAHQIARLIHGLRMTNELEKAAIEADRTDDPNRAKLVVNEVARRHEFTMSPKSSAWSAWASSAAFVYYLGATPAAALVNLSQTTVVGIPIMAARFRTAGVTGASRELMRALGDFAKGKAKAMNSADLTPDEKRALAAAYARGIIDKSQSHDLAGIAEAGAEYSDIRARLMRPIAFFFHHAERMNREVTFLAAYRLGRAEDLDHAAAIDKADRVTWDTHFNYEADARPRLLQQDWLRVALTFRNFQINMLYRLFRDTHQALNGRTADERREARIQLGGITMSMMFHAGITGTWGYALTVALLGMFAPGGADEIEEELKEGLIGVFGPQIGGALLKGVPGHATGLDLTHRLGMAELWFRSPDRQLEGKDAYAYWVEQMIGPVPAIAANVFAGIGLAADGNLYRGVETAVPKFVRDTMKAYRYMAEGVTTRKGDPVLESVSPVQAFSQAMGFSPAQVSERYEINNRRMNAQKRIEDDRSEILNAITAAAREGRPPPPKVMRQVQEFNRAHPSFAITGDTVRRSLRARIKATSDIAEGGGIRLNDKLEREIMARFGAATLYQ